MTFASWLLSWLNPFSYTALELCLITPVVVLCNWAVVSFALSLVRRIKRRSYKGSNVVITGASQGMGLEMALQLALEGANLCLIARDERKLESAVEQCRAAGIYRKDQKIFYISLDVSNAGAAVDAVKRIHSEMGSIDLLILNAGFSTPGYFLEQGMDVFRRQMEVNYFGVVNVLKAAVPGMVQRRSGQVVLVSSAAGVLGMLGYASYCPTKWALRGLADCLRQELLPANVKVSICYPADVETPGFATENETKPIETHEMSGSGTLMKPKKAAEAMLSGIRCGDYHIATDLGGWLMVTAMNSMTPRGNTGLEVLLLPVIAVIQGVLTLQWDGIVRKHGGARRDFRALDTQR